MTRAWCLTLCAALLGCHALLPHQTASNDKDLGADHSTRDSSSLTRTTLNTTFINSIVDSVTTNSAVSPAAGSLLVLGVSYVVSNNATSFREAPALLVSNSGTPLTWTPEVSAYFPNPWGAGVTFYTARVGPAALPAMTVTVKASHAMDGWGIHISAFTGYDASNPVGATKSLTINLEPGNDGSGPFDYGLPEAPLPNSIVLAMVSVNDDAGDEPDSRCYVSPGARWRELDEYCSYPNSQIQESSDPPSQQVSYNAVGSNNLTYFASSAALEIRSE